MKNTTSISKRGTALMLALSLLCGLLLSGTILPVSAETAAVKTFTADFADLAALVTEDSWDANDRYQSQETDDAINAWVSARFGLYANREASMYKERSYLGQSSYDITDFEYNGSDSWGGHHYWQIQKDGGIFLYAGIVGGQMMRKNDTLTLKTENGDLATLKNFEANVVFNKGGTNYLGGVFVSFHESQPGRMTTLNSNFKANGGNNAVVVGNGPLEYVDGQRPGVADGSYKWAYTDGIILGDIANRDNREVDEQFDATLGEEPSLDNSADYNLYVKVLNTQLTVKITKVEDGSVVYSKVTTVAAGEGYLSVGVANSARVIKSIEVAEFDQNGNKVDFGTGTQTTPEPFSWTPAGLIEYTGGKYVIGGTAANAWYTYEGATTDEAAAVVANLNENFNVYYNSEGKYYQSQHGVKQAYDGQTQDYGRFTGLYGNAWLEYNVASPGGNQNMRLINSLAPKGKDGELLLYQNFETTFQVRFETAADGPSVVFGFRQQTPGKFVNGYFNVNREQALMVLTPLGISIAGGAEIVSGHVSNVGIEGDIYDTTVTQAFDTALPAQTPVTVTVKAVGDQVSVTVKSSGKTYYSDTLTVPYTTPGYVAYGIANRKSHLGSISLTHLDENGNPVAVDAVTEAEAGMGAEQFSLSFTDLPGAEYKSNTVGETTQNVYTVTATEDFVGYSYVQFSAFTDTQAIDYISEKLDFYYNHQASAYGEVPAYGNAGGAAESGNWILLFNKWLQRSGSAGSGERVRQINSVVPKDANGKQIETRNLIAEFDFRFENGSQGTSGPSTALFAFRQQSPGKFVEDINVMNTEQVLIAITQESIAVAGGSDITAARFYHTGQFADDDCADVFAAALPQEVHVCVTAVNQTVTVEICNMSGALKYRGSFTTAYMQEGSMAFGVAASGGDIGELHIIRLNANGNRVDITDDTWSDPVFADGKTRFVANFERLAQLADTADGAYVTTDADDKINAWMDAKFELWHNREDVTVMRDHLGQSSDDCDDTKDPYNNGYTYWEIGEDATLTRKTTSVGGEWMRKGDLLVPKTAYGVPAILKNFETTFTVVDHDLQKGAVVLSFRNDTTGMVIQRYQNIYDNQQALMIGIDGSGTTGVSLGGTFTDGTGGDYYYADEKLPALYGANRYVVYVKALGDTVTVKITSPDGNTVFYENTVTATVTDAGYLSLGVYNGTKAIADWTVTQLDDSGNPVDFGAAQDSALITVDSNVITVASENGYELQAGSLIVTDANGVDYVPTRVDFQGDVNGDSNKYEVTDQTAVAPFTVKQATYVRPTADAPNIGNVGTSFSTEKQGLRFVSRFTRVTENGTEYLALDDGNYELVDYGMLISVTNYLGERELTVEVADADRNISRLSAKQKGIYYDQSKQQIDMSVCILGIGASNVHTRITARPYVIFKDASGTEVTRYADTFTSTYARNATE